MILGFIRKAFLTLSIILGFYHLVAGYFGQPEAYLFRTTHLAIILALTFYFFPLGGKDKRNNFNIFFLIDLIFSSLPLAIEIYILSDVEGFYLKHGALTPFDEVLGIIIIFLVLEATRRTVGVAMVIIALFFMANGMWADHFFSVFFGPPHSWHLLVDVLFIGENGIYGLVLMVMSSYIYLFILLGAVMMKSGASSFFIDIAFTITGRQRGGPAKAAVISSSLMGTISGSATANVLVTGSFTIPLMKKAGYRPAFAGAVEAVASTGGQFMPPVMGAAAFIIAEFLGVPYIKVCIAAALPAILYYLSVFMMVHIEALKVGLSPMPKESLPKLRKVITRGHLIIPLIVMVVVLAIGYSPIIAVTYAIAANISLSFILKDTRMTANDFLEALVDAARTALPVAMACACAGIIIGSVYVSGSSYRFSSAIIDLAGNQMYLALILTMLTSILLGMGMTTTAVYITMAALVIPALIKMGVPSMGAHLFAFYFGVISAITPPVALAAYAASGLAGSTPGKTGFEAWRLGIVAFLVPFMFVYGPELMLIGYPLATILLVSLSAMVGITSLAAGMQGWLLGKLKIFQRVLLVIASLALIKPGIYTDLLGGILIIFVLVTQKIFAGKKLEQKIFPREREDLISSGTQLDYQQTSAGLSLPAMGPIEERKFMWGDFIKGWAKLAAIFLGYFFLGNENYAILNYNLFITAVICLAVISVIVIPVRNSA